MRTIAKFAGLAALAATILPPALFMAGVLPLATVKGVMLVAAIVWFATAPVWMRVD